MPDNGKFDWETIYQEIPFDNMGWYHSTLDPDLKEYLDDQQIKTGHFLDIGTGAGNQAIELSKKGFTVIGTDISKTAITNAQERFPNTEVEFIVDNILHSKLTTKFDYIFDRGCYHNINKDQRAVFIQSVHQLLAVNGIFFLKCFSNNPNITGPFDFTPAMIAAQFKEHFIIRSIRTTHYQGTLKENPNALFVIMSKR